MTHPFFHGGAVPRVFAHRGLVTAEAAAEGVVENSFTAVAAAHAAGAFAVESDCHVTSDGVAVLFHDEDLSRVTGDPRRVADVSARELDALMEPLGGLITLDQALDSFPEVRFNLDVKVEAAVRPVGAAIAAHTDRVLIASFSDARRRATVRAAAEAGAKRRPALSPGRESLVKLLLSLSVRSSAATRRILTEVDALQIPERQGPVRVLSRRLLEAAHDTDTEVHVWTVNDPADMLRLIRLGCDGIVTDAADLAITTLQSPSR